MAKQLEVILKVAERCNIDCSYCYFFHGADTSYRSSPVNVSPAHVAQLGRYLARATEALALERICIDFHGGEPLLLGKERFAAMCRRLRESLGSVASLELRCQTNGILIDADWVRLFAVHGVTVGVSLDGPRDYHDEHRRGFDGRGTYDRVVAGVSRLSRAVERGDLDRLGVLCVIQPDRSARRILRHFVDDLGVRSMDFLLPDKTWDGTDGYDQSDYARFLEELLLAWAEDADTGVRVRTLESVFSVLLGGEGKLVGFKREPHHIITIGSDGRVGPDDTLRSCSPEFMASGFTIYDSDLADYLASPGYKSVLNAYTKLPTGCRSCCWQGVCGGGLLVNRYSAASGFDNPSVYCDALKALYSLAGAYLVRSGLTPAELEGSVLQQQA